MNEKRCALAIISSLIVLSLALPVTDAGSTPGENTPWASYGRDLRNTFHNPGSFSPGIKPYDKWSFGKGGMAFSSPAISDVDDDGTLEIIQPLGDDSIYAINPDGTEDWSYPAGDSGIVSSSPAIADIEGDGSKEVVNGGASGVYVINSDGTENWTFSTPGGVKSPAVYDVDGDGNQNVIFGVDNSTNGAVYSLNPDGTEDWIYNTAGPCDVSPAIGDLYGDGKTKIVVTSTVDTQSVIALNSDGTENWTHTVGYDIQNGASLNDIDGDGALEVLIGTGESGGRDIIALESDGTEKWTFPTGSPVSTTPNIADIDSDEENEIVAGNGDGNTVYAINPDGTEDWSTNIGEPVNVTALADINGDGLDEVLAVTEEVTIYAIDSEGNELWNISPSSASDLYSESMSIADVDEDGYADMFFTDYDGNLNSVSVKSSLLSENRPWPKYRRNNRNTGHTDESSSSELTELSVLLSENIPWDDYSRSAPAVADVDHDGNMEFATKYGMLNENGGVVWSEPDSIHPAVYDINDGAYIDSEDTAVAPGYEVISRNDSNSLDVRSAYENNGLLWWEFMGIESILGPPVIVDNNGDGKLEIATADEDVDLYKMDHKGEDGGVGGSSWDEWNYNVGGTASAVASADVDLDGEIEYFTTDDDNTVLNMVNQRGGTGWSYWPGTDTSIDSAPVIGNMDSDDELEVAFLSGRDGMVYVVDHTGNLQWEENIGVGGTAWNEGGTWGTGTFCDINDDSNEELIIPGGENIHAFDDGGVELWSHNLGSLTTTDVYPEPTSGDITGDGANDIVYSFENEITVLDENGNVQMSYESSLQMRTRSVPIVDANEDGMLELVFGTTDNFMVLGESAGSTLNVETNLPSDVTVDVTVEKPDKSTVSKKVPPVARFTGLSSATYRVTVQNTKDTYTFSHWTGDVNSENRTINVHLSEKTVTAIYTEDTDGPIPPGQGELNVDVATGELVNEGPLNQLEDMNFVPATNFYPGERVVTHVEVTDGSGDPVTGVNLDGEWGNGDRFSFIESDSGDYYGSFTLSQDQSEGSYPVSVEATKSGYEDGEETVTFNVVGGSDPEEIYRRYLEEENRARGTPFSTPDPRLPVTPEIMVALVAFFGLLIVITHPKDRWDRTPENWFGSSSDASWTGIGREDVALLIGTLAVLGALLYWYFVSLEFILTYGVMGGITVIAYLSERNNPKNEGSFIGIGDGPSAKYAVFGFALGGFFLFVVNLVTEGLGMMSLVANIPLVGLALPFLEAMFFRAVSTPTVSEWWGIVPAVIMGGILFGLAHWLFGAALFLVVTTTIFGAIGSYYTLRNQTIVIVTVAHLTFNTTILIIKYGGALIG